MFPKIFVLLKFQQHLVIYCSATSENKIVSYRPIIFQK